MKLKHNYFFQNKTILKEIKENEKWSEYFLKG